MKTPKPQKSSQAATKPTTSATSTPGNTAPTGNAAINVMRTLIDNVDAGDPQAIKMLERMLEEPVGVDLFSNIENRKLVQDLVCETPAGQRVSSILIRTAAHNKDVRELAGVNPSAASKALAERAAILKLQLEAAEHAITRAEKIRYDAATADDDDSFGLSGDAATHEYQCAERFVARAEDRRDRIEKRYIVSMRVLAEIQKTYVSITINQQAAAIRESALRIAAGT